MELELRHNPPSACLNAATLPVDPGRGGRNTCAQPPADHKAGGNTAARGQENYNLELLPVRYQNRKRARAPASIADRNLSRDAA